MGSEMCIRDSPIHEVWCKDKREKKGLDKVQAFLSHLQWQKIGEAKGGITWMELYILYAIHGGSKDYEEDRRQQLLSSPPMLQKAMADFKKQVRKINTLQLRKSKRGTWKRPTP